MTRCAAMVALMAGASRMAAQAPAAKSGSIGIMGGATFPRGSDFTAISKTGWNAGALIRLGVPAFPLSFRIDGQWHQLAGKSTVQPDVGGYQTDLRIIDGTADFEWAVGGASASNFYLIGGGGIYKLRGKTLVTPGNTSGGTESTVTENATKFGWNAGAGFRFRMATYGLFIEARYHSVSGGHSVDGSSSTKALHFIPLDIGITL
ncbi:MAG: hypothetical protein M3Y05_05005 [Gemmatimonadota bacterium]|nr:hypothetical protein [Gemmatimonadota bacterium]